MILLWPKKVAFYQLHFSQRIPASLDEVWAFISAPANLKIITPEHMGFDIRNNPAAIMYPGMIIEYRVSPFPGFRTTWVTEITHVVDKVYFVDEQREGPYRMWHHEHHLRPIPGGVLMEDVISYIPPMGILGAIANTLMIRKKVNGIFDYREQALIKHWGPWPES